MNKTVIIGSGISGLTAALLLRRRGYDVTVLEQQRQAGGALHRFRRQGVSFDVGFHYTGGLGEGDILRALWRYCGVEQDIRAIPFPDDAADCIRVNGFPHQVRGYFSYDRFSEELNAIFPGEKQGIAQFFRAIRHNADNNPFYNMSRALTDFLRQLAFPEQSSLGGLIRSCTGNIFLQAVLAHPVYLHGVGPDDIGPMLHTAVAHPVYTGMYSIDGGGQAIAKAYLDRLTAEGVEVVTGACVEQILTSGGKVAGVASSGGNFPADDVIFTGHPALLPGLAAETDLRKVYRDRLRDMDNTPSMFMVFGAMHDKLCTPELRWNNFFGLHSGLSYPGNGVARPEGCFFLSSCGLRDSGEGKNSGKGGAVILMRPASWQESAGFDLGAKKRGPGYQAWKEAECCKLLASVGEKWPGLLEGFEVINTASPLTFRDELKYVKGSVYGVQHSTNQFAVGSRTKLPGLWLSGQSTLMPGIMGAALSALITAGGMVGLESLWKEVRNCA